MEKWTNANELLISIEDLKAAYCDFEINSALDDVKRIITEKATADVQKVVHARWDDYYTRSGYAHTLCSACKTPPAKSHRVIKLHVDPSDRNDYILTNFCANCGAKMDKED